MLTRRSKKISVTSNAKKVITRNTTYSNLLDNFEVEHCCFNYKNKVYIDSKHIKGTNDNKNKRDRCKCEQPQNPKFTTNSS